MPKKLSVSIVAYRNYTDIVKAVDSLEKHTSSDITRDVLIVDNSQCQNEEIQNKFVKKITKYSDVTYKDTKENLGFGKGHNYMLKKLDSEYHCIMNPDIIFCEDAFSKILAYMDAHPEVGMVIPNIINEDGERQLVYRKDPTIVDMMIRMFFVHLFPKRVASHTLQDKDYSQPFQVPFGQGSFLVIRTSLYQQLGGFDDNFFMYLEDADLCRRVNQVSKLMYLPDANVIHKWERGSHKNLKLFWIHMKSMFYYFRKWGWQWH